MGSVLYPWGFWRLKLLRVQALLCPIVCTILGGNMLLETAFGADMIRAHCNTSFNGTIDEFGRLISSLDISVFMGVVIFW